MTVLESLIERLESWRGNSKPQPQDEVIELWVTLADASMRAKAKESNATYCDLIATLAANRIPDEDVFGGVEFEPEKLRGDVTLYKAFCATRDAIGDYRTRSPKLHRAMLDAQAERDAADLALIEARKIAVRSHYDCMALEGDKIALGAMRRENPWLPAPDESGV